ncbi:MAG TPA: DUF3179 domain-containing protein [Gaiellaceae bacterium]|nr:DUF3179 domain-containing protein [Gaiellaceae bacterium]
MVLALAFAACGGSEEKTTETELDEALSSLEEELAKNPPGPGLGEASPPPADTAAWKTDFTKRLVSLDEFQSGGPPKDGIPAIDSPRFTPASEIDWIGEREPVILVEVGGEARAYPIQVLMWHEIANDQIGEVPIAVTFCPLCNTAIVFDRRLDGKVHSFGTTGKLRDSDLVMYDRGTESWWQQFSGEALVGELAGKKLDVLWARIVPWGELRREHPEAHVLNRDTGFARDYGSNPYVGYDSIDSPPIFATRNADDDRLPPKERVVYVEIGEDAFAVPFSSLAKVKRVTFAAGDSEIDVRWKGGVASALDGPGIASGRDVGSVTVRLDGEPVPFHEPFWFAVAAFRPDIEIVDG